MTQTLFPLSFSLHTSHLHTHCSSCFSPLSIPTPSNSPSFCSPPCSAALRLLLLRSHRSSRRLAGLTSNHHLLTCHKSPSYSPEDNNVSERITLGASNMAKAIAKQRGIPCDDAVLEEATVALCAVLTNAVEVHDNEGRNLGIAVYGTTFSWINHSCSPNACYRFVLTSSSHSEEPKLRIAPFTGHSQQPKGS